MPFDFNNKRNEINDAYGSIIIPLSQLSMNDLALGDSSSTPVIGQADTFYTDNPNINSINTANSDMFTNYAVNNFGATPPTNESSVFFNDTFAGDPMPLKDNENSGSFHGTCKPVALGDYINHNSSIPTLEGSFATAGIVGTDVFLSVYTTDTNTMTPNFMTSLNCGIFMTGTDSDVRLFTYPGLDASSSVKAIILIINDWGNNNLYFFMFGWDHSSNNLGILTSTSVSTFSNDIIKYNGQHDIFYIPGANKLLLLRKDNRLEELDIDPTTNTLNPVTTIANVTAVAVDDVNRVIVTTDTNGDLITYFNSINLPPVATSVGGVLTTVFDGCYNNTVDATGFYFCAIDSPNTQLISYRFDIDSSGNIITSNSYATTVASINNWTQVETQAYNVINIFVGSNNSTSIPPARIVCDSTTLKPGYFEYDNVIIKDFMLMKHPSGSNNSINGNPASGSNHLICIDESSTITTHSKNFLNTVQSSQSTVPTTAPYQNITYLGYFYNSITGSVNYLYLGTISALIYPYDQSGNPTGGYYFYFNYDA